MKYKIVLDTVSDITNFVKNVSLATEAKVTVTDGCGLRVNAKSMIGILILRFMKKLDSGLDDRL